MRVGRRPSAEQIRIALLLLLKPSKDFGAKSKSDDQSAFTEFVWEPQSHADTLTFRMLAHSSHAHAFEFGRGLENPLKLTPP
jgi:hypothetical protein